MRTYRTVRFLTAVAGMTLLSAAAQAATVMHRYQFSNNVNDSIGSTNGTLTGANTYLEAPTYVTDAPAGTAGGAQALRFGVTTGKKSGLALANSTIDLAAGSISLWIKPAQATDTDADYILNLPTSYSNGIGILISSTMKLTAVVGNSGSFTSSDTSAALTVNQWSLITLTWDGSTAALYLNGAQVTTKAYAGLSTSAGLRFGNYDFANSSANVTNQYLGAMYELQIYSGVLSASDVASLYNNPGTAVPEPASFSVACLAGFAMLGRRRP